MVKPHVPFRQLAMALAGPQGTPHAPQLARSFVMFTSQPSIAFLLQSPNPILHIPMPHAPPAQPAVAFAGAMHTLPHLPQLFTSVAIAVSQPSMGFIVQCAKPIMQEPGVH